MTGRFDDEPDAPARVGEMGTLDAMLMTPGAIASELARIDTQMRSFHNELYAAARARGYVDPTVAVAGISDWIKGLFGFAATGPTGAAQQLLASATAAANANPGHTNADDPRVKAVLDAANVRKVPADPVVHLFVDGWLPLWNTWRTFYASEKDGSWWHNAAYDAEKYQQQLAQVRAQAEALGVKFATPAPPPEHTGSSWFSLAKYGLIGAGVLGAIYVIRSTRKGG